jgi:hypothetical protein
MAEHEDEMLKVTLGENLNITSIYSAQNTNFSSQIKK